MMYSLDIRAFSDTHLQHNKLTIPKCDLLIFCGDYSCHREYREKDLIEFNRWLGTLQASKIVFVAGNHDVIFEQNKERSKELLTNAIYLENELIEFEGVKIYGTPYGLKEDGWAFGKTEEELKDIYAKIPECNILVSHYPPYNVLDLKSFGNSGSKALREKIFEINPRVVFFGHAHNESGFDDLDGMLFINCSIVGTGNKWVNRNSIHVILEKSND